MSNVIPFRPKPKQSPPSRVQDVPDVLVIRLWNTNTGEQIDAVDEAGAAAKLCISVEEFRAQQPFGSVPDTGDELLFSVEIVAAEMVRRRIPVGEIVRGR